MKITIHQAISFLLPGSEFSIKDNDYDQIDWWDEVYQKPTKEEVEAEIKRLELEHNKTEYQRQRAPEYPSITDQLDSLFHAGVFPPDMAAKIQAVKNKFPKPLDTPP